MKVEVEKTNNSPRLNALGDVIVKWVNSYPKDEFINVNEGVELLILGVDNKYKGRLCFMLGNNEDPIDSAFNATNHGIGNFLNKDNILEGEVFTGVANYIARVCSNNPDIWNKFKTFVEEDIKNIKIKEVNDSIQEG